MDASELRKLLKHQEGPSLEFKSAWDLSGATPAPVDRRLMRDKVVEVVAAFANADGGTLVVGADDDGTPSGHGFPDEAVASLIEAPRSRTTPSVSYRVDRIELDGKKLVVFEVMMAPEAVMVDGNGFPMRIVDQLRRDSQAAINARKEAYRRVGYEQEIEASATLGDIDLDLVVRTLASSPFADRGPIGLLEHLGLIHPGAGAPGISRGALLLFAKGSLARWHPSAGIRVQHVEGTERRHGRHRNVTQVTRIDEPLARALPMAHEAIRGQIKRSERLHDLYFREHPEYPSFAWQEAVVNAVAHRDYRVHGQEIEVWLYDDRLEVWSPGDLVPTITLQALRDGEMVHASRNPLLARTLVAAGTMREEGEGIPRMREEMRESMLHDPELDLDSGRFLVRLRNTPIFVGPSIEWTQMVDAMHVSIEQRRILATHPDGFASDDYQRVNDVDRDRAYRDIKELVDVDILTMEGSGRGARYAVAPQIVAHRSFLESRRTALQAHFEQNSRLMNAEYRDTFDVSRHQATSELRQLIDEEMLRLQGEKRGAHYVPGPRLRG